MKVVFFSNYLNHHQLPFCKQMCKLTDNNFYFVSQKAISEKRIPLGYKDISNDYDFIVKTYEDENSLKKAYQLADEADYVLFGSSNVDYLKNRLKNNRITLKYSERLFKKDLKGLDYLKAFRRVYVNHGKYKNKNMYMLCASNYAAYDFNRFNAYKNKTYKWGYFPETKYYDIDELMIKKQRKPISILWVGRLIDWKHPELAIEVARKLKENGKSFVLRIIGQGLMEEELKTLIDRYQLNDCVKMLGSMSPDEVREKMEESNIFLFTSDKQEGWGAVLNEAMNSSCACVASHLIGSSGFLIKHKENGLIFKDGDLDDLYNKVLYLFDNDKQRETIGINAYKTISELWNGRIAAERFLNLCKLLDQGKDTPYEQGPCSKAYPLSETEAYRRLVENE